VLVEAARLAPRYSEELALLSSNPGYVSGIIDGAR
jgi:hypothetical protein